MRLLLPVSLLLIALPGAVPAQGVKRCTDAQGNTVFTDRSCASLDAVPKGAPVPSGTAAAAPDPIARGCARTPEDLLARVRTALEARDVNQLASHYHWTGTGTRSGLKVMDELEAIATRPFVAATLAYPATPEAVDPLLAFGPGPASAPEPAPAEQAIGLDLQQMAGDDRAGSRSTRFRLQRNVGCWWLEL